LTRQGTESFIGGKINLTTKREETSNTHPDDWEKGLG